MIARDVLEEIRRRTNCVDLARSLGVVGHRGTQLPNRARVSARCPAHDDVDPSATIYADGWKCHACGAGGDAIDLVRTVYGCTFAEAVAELAERAGVTIPDRATYPCRPRALVRAPEDKAPRRRTVEQPEVARQVYGWLWEHAEPALEHETARRYLTTERGLPAQVLTPDRVRALDGVAYGQLWETAVRAQKLEALTAAGLVNCGKPHPRPHGALLLYGYRDASGELAHIRWRPLRPGGHTLSPCHPSSPPGPYLGERARGARALIVVEGEIDALSMTSLSLAAVGMPGATACRPEWLDGWRDMDRVIVLGDGDGGGETLCRTVSLAAVRRFGRAWAKRVETYLFPTGTDANDGLRAGWLATSLDELAVEVAA